MEMPEHKQARSLQKLLGGPLDLLTQKERRTSLVILASIFVNSVVDLQKKKNDIAPKFEKTPRCQLV